jgi:tRNA dimethylallyltransferase
MRFPPGDAASATRAHYEAVLGSSGGAALHALLAARDAPSAILIHPANVRRVVRALEMLDAGGPSYAEQHAAFHERTSVYETVHIGLSMDRATLYARIGARVDRMLGDGLLDEVRGLLDAGFRHALTAPQAIGYKELVPVVEDGADVVDAAEAIKRATRRYAKRQLTWFRADPRVRWLDVTTLPVSAAVAAAEALIESGRDEGHRS